MTVVYWAVAALLALFYLYSGALKLMRSREQLAPMMAWADSVPVGMIRARGVVEVFGALGLVLPPSIGVGPGLALAAAVGFVVLQLAATVFHATRREPRDLWLNVVLIVLAGLAAWSVPLP